MSTEIPFDWGAFLIGAFLGLVALLLVAIAISTPESVDSLEEYGYDETSACFAPESRTSRL